MSEPLSPTEIIDRLATRYADKVTVVTPPGKNGHPYVAVDRDHVLPILDFLKNDPELRFDFLMDVTVVDHLYLEIPEIGERFASVDQLYSLEHNHRFTVKARVPENDPRCPSAIGLWKSALWGEREAHDMYGVEYEGNPDMRRLLMPEDFPGFPLRKDYPLRGQGERDAFPQYRHQRGGEIEDGTTTSTGEAS